jgi:non-heme chloroperoxidase
MAITQRETEQIESANTAGRTPVMFIHGLWLLPASWQRWAELFEQEGYAALTPSWPDDPETVEQVVIGHSFGGLLAQITAGRGLSAATVAIDPAPFRGVLPLPISALRSAMPVLSNPANRKRAVTLTFEQFRYGWANAVSESEAHQLYDEFHVAAPGAPLFQAATANFNPFTEAKVPDHGDRGPLLIISGGADHTVPWAIANASYKRQHRHYGVTEITEVANRGHALTIDAGWREVADTALAFVKRFV